LALIFSADDSLALNLEILRRMISTPKDLAKHLVPDCQRVLGTGAGQNAFMFVVTSAMSFIALFVLRRREPDLPRPYRAWGHPWTTGLIVLASLAFMGGTLAADRGTGLAALALCVLSWPVYRFTVRRAR
jgi:hypothetical protein